MKTRRSLNYLKQSNGQMSSLLKDEPKSGHSVIQVCTSKGGMPYLQEKCQVSWGAFAGDVTVLRLPIRFWICRPFQEVAVDTKKYQSLLSRLTTFTVTICLKFIISKVYRERHFQSSFVLH